MVYLLSLGGLLGVAKWLAARKYEADCRRDYERQCMECYLGGELKTRLHDVTKNDEPSQLLWI
jgi:hypothetical protein